jgi:regulator of cell morphogenesis and NO signaling
MMSTERTLGELVATHPAAAKVFHRHHLDFCCGGEETLAAACAAHGLSPDTVLREVDTAVTDQPQEVRWNDQPVPDLIRHILERYHAPLRLELPRLVELARKVEHVHADNPERPAGLTALLADVHEAVESHLAKEEQILFPLILSGRGPMAHMPVQVMVQEHDDHGQSLRRIRELTRDFRVPAEACASWRELYRALQQLETDLMAHIHLENHVLFPRALGG